MKSLWVIIVIALCAVALKLWVFPDYDSTEENTVGNDTQEEATVEADVQNEENELNEESNKEIARKVDNNNLKDGNEDIENKFLNTVHKMTHQKVLAENKNGHLMITEERIDEMIEIVETYNIIRRDYFHESMLDWKDGDFTNATQLHNRIWSVQDGMYGKATRNLDSYEEQLYIEEHFNENGGVKEKYKEENVDTSRH